MALPRTPGLATDCVIFDPVGRVLLIRRKHAPCAGSHALPGGFVKVGETVEDACRREVREETSVELNELALVGVYSDLNRDPRGHIVSIAYTTRLPSDVLPRAGSDATSAEWVDTSQVTLGLDHAQILADAKAKIFSHIRSEGHDPKRTLNGFGSEIAPQKSPAPLRQGSV